VAGTSHLVLTVAPGRRYDRRQRKTLLEYAQLACKNVDPNGMLLPWRLIAAAAPTLAQSLRRWVYQLGGVGLIPLGLLDSSVIPLPGSMDVLTIVLSARKQELWFYYALMATAGSVIGGFVTYRLARKGGKEALPHWVPRKALTRANKMFERWGFGAIAVPALLPPPAPMVPFLFAAGTMQYSAKKFLAALTLGRIVRYSILAFLAARYGRRIILVFISHLGNPIVLGIIGLGVTAAVIVVLVLAGRMKPSRSRS
jgi:membrane protein YqaA with SNARE-associated domain